MTNALICSALGVAPDRWPPDHYALLGISPGAVDPLAVEERVLERMERLRHYQLVHPEAVTEAMNRLAQALVCLSDPATKTAYDAGLRRAAPSKAAVATEAPAMPYPLAAPEPLAQIARRAAPPSPRPRRDDHRRDLFHRLASARHLLAAWRDLGNYIGEPGHRVRQPAEAIDLAGALLELRDCLRDDDGPPIGLPGQAGALVTALARQPLPISTYRQFLPDQRAALAADWQAGERQLSEDFRSLARSVHRPRGFAVRRTITRAARLLVADWLDVALIVVGVAAVGIALWRTI